jgi:hypothetical protein
VVVSGTCDPSKRFVYSMLVFGESKYFNAYFLPSQHNTSLKGTIVLMIVLLCELGRHDPRYSSCEVPMSKVHDVDVY